MKPSLYFRAFLGECIPIPDMTAAEILAIEEGIRGILEATERMSLSLPEAIRILEGDYERKWNELIETTGDRIAQAAAPRKVSLERWLQVLDAGGDADPGEVIKLLKEYGIELQEEAKPVWLTK